MSTPHNSANLGDIAKIVLMPGDPLRAEVIANTYLTDVVRFNTVRNMFGYTGYYNGKKISVMGSGMGMPSIGIYSYELFKFYNVEKIIRIGSCGAYTKDLDLYDVILVSDAYSESSFAKAQSGFEGDITYPSLKLNQQIEENAHELDIPLVKGRIHSSDVFYHEASFSFEKVYKEKQAIAVEMESFALFHNAKVLNKEAACILTVSDNLVTKEETTADERQNAFSRMMKLALSLAE